MFDPFATSSPSPRPHRRDGRRPVRRLDVLADAPPLAVDDEPCPPEPPWPEDPEAAYADAIEHPAGAAGPERSAPAAGRLVEHWVPGGAAGWRRVTSAVRGRRWVVLVVVGMVVAVATAVGMLASRPTVEPAPALPPALGAPRVSAPPSSSTAPAKIVVSVVGKVVRPGLVTVPGGARVADALRAAGGSPPGTNVTALNLARKLSDGEQIYVGIPVPPGAAPPVAAGGDPTAGGGSAGSAQQKVDLNTATVEQLDELPGVGEVTAQNILDWRAQHGRFASVGQLNQVDGIGEVRFGRLKDLVTVG